ncbi:PaaI family thioesterase [Cereibacter johrii]|uniref:PaaI family thioesterase n=1 Tax=Cereibacter johrii TaxID=445629 RepID=UPI000DCB52AF|nr:PaaI family thioesterase [Cereibacter johrii]RAZ82056.1 PaaI family thioesterase [Cereibacter johrii]RDS95939.1 PaaI family thioesterase [Cereibacter sphaeroides f. sp. denitrificans]
MTLFAECPEDFPAAATVAGMSGMDYMQAMLEGRVPEPTIGRIMGYRLVSVEPGRVVWRGVPAFAHTNAFGGVHGGWYGTILDSAMGCAVMTGVPKGRRWTTLEFKVNITRALPIGRDILAVGISDHAGRTTAVAHGEIRDAEDDRLYATGSTTCLLLG